MNEGQTKTAGIMAMVVGAGLLVTNDAVVKTLANDLTLLQIIGFRSLGIIILFSLFRFTVLRRRAFVCNRAVLARTIFSVANIYCFVAAVTVIPLSTAIVIDFSNILFVALLSPVLLRIPFQFSALGAALIGFTGAVVIIGPSCKVFGPVILLPVLSAIFGALREIWTRKLPEGINVVDITLLAAAGAALPAILIGDLGSVNLKLWTGIKVLTTSALFGAAFLLMTLSFRLADPRIVAPFRYTALLWGLLLAALMFGEIPTVGKMSGIVLVVVGTSWALSLDVKRVHKGILSEVEQKSGI